MVAGRRKWALWLWLVGIFFAGGVAGVFAAAGYVHHRLRALHEGGPHALHALGMQWLDWRLELSPEQEASIDAIVREAHLELLRFKGEHNDEIRAIVVPAVERIDAELTPAQAQRWGEIRQRILEHAEMTLEPRTGH